MKLAFIVSCEHAGNRVPASYAEMFCGADDVLASHRGWDPGTLELGRELSQAVSTPLIATTVTRLLVEVNRSPRHPNLFSEFSKRLTTKQREAVIDRYYRPHRDRVEAALRRAIRVGQVAIHLSVHSFTPNFNGEQRLADIGLLYDPSRSLEKEFCRHWRNALQQELPKLRVRCNYPYRGTSDGLTTFFRQRFPARRYLGIELEINQRLVTNPKWYPWRRQLVRSLRCAKETF